MTNRGVHHATRSAPAAELMGEAANNNAAARIFLIIVLTASAEAKLHFRDRRSSRRRCRRCAYWTVTLERPSFSSMAYL